MTRTRVFTIAACAMFAVMGTVGLSYADEPRQGRGNHGRSGHVAVPRTSPPPAARSLSPRLVRPASRLPLHSYGLRRWGADVHSGFGLGFSRLRPYAYDPFGYAYGYGFPAAGYAAPVSPYGGVRITKAPRDAEVYVDGYYAGTVDSFDGRFQRLTLEPGPHQIEVRSGSGSRRFDVNVQPGRTMTYRADLQQ